MSRRAHGAVALAALVLAGGATLASADAERHGADGAGPAPRWLSLGVLAGAAQFDPRLADYQWDVTPRMGFGLEALAGVGGIGLGLRVWRAQTTQHIDLASDPNPIVTSTSAELVGRGRMLTRLGVDLEASATVGRIALGYDPDRITVTSGGSAFDVELAPVHAWVGGGGLALRRPLGGAWAARIEADARGFSMTTAHRSAGATVVERQRFDDWSLTLGLARELGRR